MHHLPTGTVTLLFSDIEGSTRLLQQLGEGYRDLLTHCQQLLRTAFQQYHGHEVDTQGDSFFVAFARATDAVSAAVAAQRALASSVWSEGVTVRVRMGLHTGEPQFSSEGYVGLDVHRAARIMSAGHGGQVLLSATTQELVKHDLPEGVSLRDLGAFRLKDLQHPSHIFQLMMADLPVEFPPLKTLDSYPNNLPIQPTPLIGRAQEIATVAQLLRREDIRLVTLTGSGGTGKTRLALQVAAELSDVFSDGVYFVNLAPLNDPARVVPLIAQTLDIKEVAGQSLLDLLKGVLYWKHLLLLLDNFEQVADAAVDVAGLLAVCPHLKVLVTSRMSLHVRGEQEFAVPPLAVPDLKHLPGLVALSQYEAVALFIQRAQAVKSEFQVTNANAPAVAEICTRLDGLPLAIELAAARIKLLSPQALLARLGQRLQILTSGARDVPARQKTLRNTIAWSYHLLDADEKQLFRRLAVFVGGCTLETAEAISLALGDAPADVLDRLSSLIDKSLVQQTDHQEEAFRLLMLETIREYGLEMLVANDEMERVRQAHALYYLARAEEKRLVMHEREYNNMQAALLWLLELGEAEHDMELALRFGAALNPFWAHSGRWREGRTYLERGLVESKGVAPQVRAKALSVIAYHASMLGDNAQAEVWAEEALALFRELGDKRGTLYTLDVLTMCMGNDLARVRTGCEEVLALAREIGDVAECAWMLLRLADVATVQGEYIHARTLYEESMTLYLEEGVAWAVNWLNLRLASLAFLSQGPDPIIHSVFEKSLADARKRVDRPLVAKSLYSLGLMVLSEGDPVRARTLAEESLTLHRELGIKDEEAKLFALLGAIEFSLENYPAARIWYEESLLLARRQTEDACIADGLEGLASVIAAQGEPTWAVLLWGAAESLREVKGIPLPPVYRAACDRSVATARTQLGEKAFAITWTAGRAMAPEQALEAHTRMGETSSTPSVKSPPTYPNDLTAREVEVLHLVAQGLTDAQVAEQLVVSSRTVNTHLTSIYGKIGVSSRSAATRYALEHQLV